MKRPWILSQDRPARIRRAEIVGATVLAIPFVILFSWANHWELTSVLGAIMVGLPLMGGFGWAVFGTIRRVQL